MDDDEKSVWQSHKNALRTLYVVKNRPLREIIQLMKQRYSFSKKYGPRRLFGRTSR